MVWWACRSASVWAARSSSWLRGSAAQRPELRCDCCQAGEGMGTQEESERAREANSRGSNSHFEATALFRKVIEPPHFPSPSLASRLLLVIHGRRSTEQRMLRVDTHGSKEASPLCQRARTPGLGTVLLGDKIGDPSYGSTSTQRNDHAGALTQSRNLFWSRV